EHWKAILGPLLVLLALFARGGIAGAIEQGCASSPVLLWQRLTAGARSALAGLGRGRRRARAQRLTLEALRLARGALQRARSWPAARSAREAVARALLLGRARQGRR